MKYPKLISALLYKRISKSTYYVRNAENDEEYELDANIVKFMNKLDGKTDPYTVNTYFSEYQIEDILDWLCSNELITKTRIRKLSLFSYGISLFRIKASQRMKVVSRCLNFLLMVTFLPVFFTGLLLIRENFFCLLYDDHLSYFFGTSVGLCISVILHEFGHVIAALGYNAHVFDVGIMVGITPGAFVQIDDENLKSSLKKAQICCAGIEMNLFIAGTSMILMNSFNDYLPFFAGVGFINLLASIINLLPIIGVDGSQILDKLIGGDFIIYSDMLIKSKSFIRDSFHRGVTGFANFTASFLTIGAQITYPLLVVWNAFYFINILRR